LLIEVGIVPGTIVESHRDADKEEDKLLSKSAYLHTIRTPSSHLCLDVCYFIDHEGNIAGKYIKKNLWYIFHSSHVIFSAQAAASHASTPHCRVFYPWPRLTPSFQGPRARSPHQLHPRCARSLRHAHWQSGHVDMLGLGVSRSIQGTDCEWGEDHVTPFLIFPLALWIC
jgi:hypothetical protein